MVGRLPGITGYGYGWDKTRTGLLVLLAALVLYLWRHIVQDKGKVRLREEVPATPEEQVHHPEHAQPTSITSLRPRSRRGAG